jgi:ribose 5-phosphate isomerase A
MDARHCCQIQGQNWRDSPFAYFAIPLRPLRLELLTAKRAKIAKSAGDHGLRIDLLSAVAYHRKAFIQMANDHEKEVAARASLRFVQEGNIVGLGTGSTAAHAVRLLGERVRAGLKIRGIPTSTGTKTLALAAGIALTTLDEFQQIDVTIDGTDEFDPQLNLIKGGGGALLREKVIASASKQLVIIADSSKQVATLGKFPLPVEVIAFAEALVGKKIAALGAKVQRRQTADGKPYITDEGHHILDCHFGHITDPPALARTLEAMPGIVEHGLFIGMASFVLMAKGDEVQEFRGK